MNEEANTQLIQRVYQSVKAGNIQSLLNVLAADVRFEMPEITNVPFAGTWRGPGRVAQFFARMREVQDIVEFKPEEFIAQNDKVVVLGRFTMVVRATGRTSQSAWAHVWTIEEGKVKSMREYVDTLAVSKAYGSPEPGWESRTA
jgi:uncharacterized protein